MRLMGSKRGAVRINRLRCAWQRMAGSMTRLEPRRNDARTAAAIASRSSSSRRALAATSSKGRVGKTREITDLVGLARPCPKIVRLRKIWCLRHSGGMEVAEFSSQFSSVAAHAANGSIAMDEETATVAILLGGATATVVGVFMWQGGWAALAAIGLLAALFAMTRST